MKEARVDSNKRNIAIPLSSCTQCRKIAEKILEEDVETLGTNIVAKSVSNPIASEFVVFQPLDLIIREVALTVTRIGISCYNSCFSHLLIYGFTSLLPSLERIIAFGLVVLLVIIFH